MRPTAVHEIARMAAAEVWGAGEQRVERVVIDSRAVQENDLFVALPGTRAHGVEFAAEAASRGAAAILVDSAHEQAALIAAAETRGAPVAVLVAPDALEALGRLAAAYRATLAAKVVGITGSTGKTTTKDMLAAALRSRRVVASALSHNNEIGVPLTLLAAGDQTEVVVVEMAMRGAGQIRSLAKMAAPEVGVITNVGVTHFELLGSRDAIADAKGELLEELPPDGLAVLNGDEERTRALAARTKAPTCTYGLEAANDVTASGIEALSGGHVGFTVSDGAGSASVELPVPGRHNAYNALAAVCVALWLGVTLEEAARGIADVELSPMRMGVFTAGEGITVINDCYNANPASMIAGLEALADIADDAARRVAVLGNMSELGSLSAREHAAVGLAARERGVRLLFTVGEEARVIGEEATGAGSPQGGPEWFHFENAQEAAAEIPGRLAQGDIVLVKASRSVGLERVVEAIAGGS